MLYDSFLQAQIIGQEVERSAARLFAYDDLMGLLEEEGLLLNRASENLPDAEEIADRRRAGRGMERPELAVLVAYAKRWVARSLEASKFIDDPWLERDLHGYFPPAVIERCSHLLAEHPLRRQLLCMASSNSVVNALGPTFVSQVVAERGCDAGRRRARLPDRARGHRRGGALGRGREARGHRARDPGRADGRGRRGRGQRDALVPLVGARGRPRDGDRRRARRRRAALRGAAGARHRGAPDAPAGRRGPARRRGRARPRSPPPTRSAPSSSTRPTWSPSPPRPAATSTTSPRSSSPSAPSCGSTGSRPS